MEKVKKGLRLFAMVLFLIIASVGIGIGNILNNQSIPMDKRIQIERLDKREDEDAEQPNIEA